MINQKDTSPASWRGSGGSAAGVLALGILGLGEGRSTMSAALQSPKWELKTICDRNEDLCKHRAEDDIVPCF